MAKKVTRICVILVLFVAANPALANITIDFEDFPDVPFASHTKSGVTFTASEEVGEIHRIGAPNGTWSIHEWTFPYTDPQKELRADIASGATFVSVDLGDSGGDSDLLFLEIFDASGTLLGYTELEIPASFKGMKTLSLSAPNIAYAVFGAREAFFGSSVHADNFEFTPIPTPSAIILGTIGVGFVTWLRKRRTL